MNLLRKAANETIGALGINVPTVLVVILSLGFKFIIIDALSSSENDSISSSEFWLGESIAWLTAVAVVFALFLLWNFSRVLYHERSIREHQRFATMMISAADERMKSFIRNSLSEAWYGVARCYGFGSVLGEYPTRDVDIIIQFESSEPRSVRQYRQRLRAVESGFRELHDRNLHIQTFCFRKMKR